MQDEITLSTRQKNILRMLHDFGREFGYPPTIRQIGAEVGISSTSVVSYNLKVLERKGYLERDRDVSRGLRLVQGEVDDLVEGYRGDFGLLVSVPLYGVIAAGEPIPVPDSDFPDSEVERISITTELLKKTDRTYALRVRGDSMIDALINDGDIVIMRHQQTAENGDLVAAWLKDEKETTLKRYHLDRDRGLVRLQPANPAMEPIYVHPGNLEIQGKVVLVIRQLD
ncbi:MAG TPA: transcriptional repressor LexA [Anaerolineae bacterium]|nr:transcriptional repressor LexA [Anaerolineae bacterium]